MKIGIIGAGHIGSTLTRRLTELGHDVTLYASGDSRTSARLVAGCPRSLRLDPGCEDPIAHHIAMLDRVARERSAYDILHFHIDYLHYPLSRCLGWRRCAMAGSPSRPPRRWSSPTAGLGSRPF